MLHVHRPFARFSVSTPGSKQSLSVYSCYLMRRILPSIHHAKLYSSNVSSGGSTGTPTLITALSAAAAPPQPQPQIKDVKFLFNQVWNKIEKEIGGKDKWRLPNEIVWLMGAPGSGKGTNTPAIVRARGMSPRPIVISHLLQKPDTETKRLMERGEMVGDELVLELLIKALLNSDPDVGVLVDGFPRTEVQGEFLKLLYDKMAELRTEFFGTPQRNQFRRPIFRITALYVDEAESVKRQLKRGSRVRQYNRMVEITGQGNSVVERSTDNDENLIKSRYKVFLEHFGALAKLKKFFPFHLINAVGPVEDVMHAIWKEFEYQSSYELDQRTFDTIQHVPIASKIGEHARQDLVRRLESYSTDAMRQAVNIVDTVFVPTIRRHAISGSATVRIDTDVVKEIGGLLDVVMDILSERGYRVSVDCRSTLIPVKVDRETFEIKSVTKTRYVFELRFPQHALRGVYSGDTVKELTGDVSSTEPERI